MSDTQSYPYETRLNVYYKPLEVIDEKTLADACTYKWYNQTLCQVSDSAVRGAKSGPALPDGPGGDDSHTARELLRGARSGKQAKRDHELAGLVRRCHDRGATARGRAHRVPHRQN
jgi:hypothetical protein